MEAKKLAQVCRDLAENRKAEEIVILDVHELSSITDYFVICSGTSEPHLRAISDEIVTKLKQDHGITPHHDDTNLKSGWVVLDFFDVIVHVMHKDSRARYDLESLWGDAPKVKDKEKEKEKDRSKAKPKAKSGTKRAKKKSADTASAVE